MGESTTSAAAPLTGIGVIEIGHSVAVPFATQILADLGATVIKIERPEIGDDARHWIPPSWHGTSAVFQTVNRNKYSSCSDLKSADGRRSIRELAANADVVIQNMRPGLIQQCQLDADTLRADNPRLIYCNLSAFGSIGPLRDGTGYDPLMQAFSGIMSVTGEPGRPPVRVGPSIIDMGAALWCVIGVLAALARRDQDGKGGVVDTSLFETGLAWMNIPLANSMASGREGERSGSETPMLAPYRAYQAADRHVVIAAGNDNLFRRLCEAICRTEWTTDPRFLSNASRVANRGALNELLAELIATQPEAYWTQRLTAAGVPCAPLQNSSEVLTHPQTQAIGMLQTIDGMDLVASPLRFDGTRPQVRSKAPLLGAHTEQALQLLRSRREEPGP